MVGNVEAGRNQIARRQHAFAMVARAGFGLLHRLVPLCAAAMLVGCMPPPSPYASAAYPGIRAVTVNGVAMSPEAALRTLAQTDHEKLADIKVETPIASSVRIVVPDHDRLRPVIQQQVRTLNAGALELVSKEDNLTLHNAADVVIRSGTFRSATVVEQNDTAQPDFGGADYLLWFQVRSVTPHNLGPWFSHWELKRAGNPREVPVGFDMGTPAGPVRMESFVASVRAGIHDLDHNGLYPSQLHSTGSGIVVDAQGHVLTDNHVVAACADLHVVDTNGTTSEASVAARDPANDLALLDTRHRWQGRASFRDSGSLQAGETLVATGFPLVGVVSPDMAVTTGSVTTLTGIHGDSRQFEFSAPVEPGNSGGPVLDDTGHVVGVTVGTLNSLLVAVASGGAMPQNVNFAIKSSSAHAFLDANHVAFDQGGGGRTMSPADVANLAHRFTVRVECR